MVLGKQGNMGSGKTMYEAFVYLEKAFDNIDWNKMFHILQ